jgi:CRP/FNR family cyclic AMP-dependent transcriptional regulator
MAARTAVDTIGFLRRTPLFAGVREESLLALARTASTQAVPKGSYVFLQSDAADAMYVVQTGVIALVLSNADGRDLVINEARPGDCFGELALLTGQARSSSATARVDSTVLAIPRTAFMASLEREPSLTRSLLEITARRLHSSSERESALAFMDAETRLVRVLLQLDEHATDKGYVTISQEELAQRAGLTRQTVASALGRWRRKGWLVTGRGRIMLLGRPQLQRLGPNEDGHV